MQSGTDIQWTASEVASTDQGRNALSQAAVALNMIFTAMVKDRVSDCHLQSSAPPCLRFGGMLVPYTQIRMMGDPQFTIVPAVLLNHLKAPLILPHEVSMSRVEQSMARHFLGLLLWSRSGLGDRPITAEMIHQWFREIDQHGSLNFSAEFLPAKLETESAEPLRMRIAAYYERSGISISIRMLPARIPKFAELGFAHETQRSLRTMAGERNGLILFTGTVNSGKSTAMAALIDDGNRAKPRKLVTIEQPIEFRFPQIGEHEAGTLVSQREVGLMLPSFTQGLVDVLRADAQCVLVGEIRQKEEMMAAMHAALAGQMVFGSLHASSAVDTIDRIGTFFPESERKEALSTLSRVLRGIVYQVLLPSSRTVEFSDAQRKQAEARGHSAKITYEAIAAIREKMSGNEGIQGGGRVMAYEYMQGSGSVRSLIRKFADEGPKFRIVSFAEEMKKTPHCPFERSLLDLKSTGKIAPVTYEEQLSTFKTASVFGDLSSENLGR